MMAAGVRPPPPWQSASVQQHVELHTLAIEHLCVVGSHESVVQSFLSSQSALRAQAMQPSLGSQIAVEASQLPLSGVLEHTPPLQLSLVQAIWSLQSVSPQQALQPSLQHLRSPQPPNEHLPETQAAVPWQTSVLLQSLPLMHSAVLTQLFAA